MPLAPGTRIASYEIERLAGAGGMGEVYRARETRLDRTVALKLLPVEIAADASRRTRFEREARAAATLSHPNICTIYDVGEADGHLFIAMEFLDGVTLSQRVAAGPPLEVSEILEIGLQIADALKEAARARIVHRDLKSSNIMLLPRGQVKVLDFGLAKRMREDAADASTQTVVTDAGTVVGTVSYMSPEQALGQDVDHRGDLFSFGVVLFELLTGRLPFTGATTMEVFRAVMSDPPPPIARFNPRAPDALVRTVDKLLEKDREHRYQSAHEVWVDLRRVARHSTDADALAPSSSDRHLLAGMIKRHRLSLALTGIAVIGLAAGVTWMWRTWRSSDPPTAASSPTTARVEPLTLTGDIGLSMLSLDAKFVVYSRMKGHDYSVWVRQLGGEGEVEIVGLNGFGEQHPMVFTIMPDGSAVDFVTHDSASGTGQVWRVPLLGGQRRRLALSVSSAIGWSPDARHMAFVRRNDAEDVLVIADPDGSNERVLASRRGSLRFASVLYPEETSYGVRPSWSADGKTLLVGGRSGAPDRVQNSYELVLVDVASGAERQTVPLERTGLIDAAWWDDTRVLLNSTLGSPTPQLQLFDLRTRAVTPLTQGLGRLITMSVSADRRLAVSLQQQWLSSLWVGTGLGTEMREVVPEAASYPRQGALDLAGNLFFIAFTPSGGGVFRLGRGQSTPVLVVDNAIAPVVTANGARIVFRRTGDRPGLYRVNADGSAVTLLAEGDAANAALTRDEKTVLFISRRNAGAPGLWSVPLDGGTPKELAHRSITTAPAISPGGDQIMFGAGTRNGQPVQVICDLPNCTNAKELRLRSAQWTPDGRGVAFVEEPLRNISFQPLNGGASRTLTNFPASQEFRPIRQFAWSADGSRLVVGRLRQIEDLVLIRFESGQTQR